MGKTVRLAAPVFQWSRTKEYGLWFTPNYISGQTRFLFAFDTSFAAGERLDLETVRFADSLKACSAKTNRPDFTGENPVSPLTRKGPKDAALASHSPL